MVHVEELSRSRSDLRLLLPWLGAESREPRAESRYLKITPPYSRMYSQSE